MGIPTIITVEFIPPQQLCLDVVSERVYKAHLSDMSETPDKEQKETAEFATQMIMQDYEHQPDPCKRLAYYLEIHLQFFEDATTKRRKQSWWLPFVETARAAVKKLESSDEELRKDAFRDLFRLRQLFRAEWEANTDPSTDHFMFSIDSSKISEGIPRETRMRWDEDACIPVYPCGTWASFADVQLREEPEDEVLRKLYRSRSLMAGLSKRHHRCKAELELLNVLIDQRESELLTSARQ